MNEFLISIHLNDVYSINKLPIGSTIVLKDTSTIEKEALKKIRSDIKVRIIGGLDEKEKPKYNSQKYYDRTIYSPMELYKIIEKMESIEKNIKPDWNDLDRAMYIYQQLCDGMKYDHEGVKVNGRDYNRNLLGLLRGKSVCAGFSMIYKEMLERQGINCYYQNKQHGHAWNLIEVNGKIVPVDLTFDIGVKERAGKCIFAFFGRNRDFFSDPNHIVTDEEIIETDLLSDNEFNESYNKVISNIKTKDETNYVVNNHGEKIYYYIMSEGKNKRCIFYNNRIMKTVLYDNTVSDEEVINADYSSDSDNYIYSKSIENRNELYKTSKKCSSFKRKDGTSFMLITDGIMKNNVIEHDYISFDDLNLPDTVSLSKLYSENDLTSADYDLNPGIANVLLSRSRVMEKVNRFRGYVGFIGIENGSYIKYYNSENERRISGVIR